MSSTDTTKPTSANKARPAGTRRVFFPGACTTPPASSTTARQANTTPANPASTSSARQASTTSARPANTTPANPASTIKAPPASTTSARSAGATANPINPRQTSPTSPTGSGTKTNPNNVLRLRMAEELSMFGMALSSQQTYLAAVDRLASRSWQSIEQLSEDDIRQYMLNLRDNGAAQGTFKTNWFGLQFLYEHVLGREWALFTKKRSANQDKSAFPVSVLTSRCNAS